LMPQFSVYRNRNPQSKGRFPLLLDVQSDLLEPLATRVVVPLAAAASARSRVMKTLTPIVKIDGKEYLLLIPQLAGIAANTLGPSVGNLVAERQTVTAALDFLIAGY
jgi:toxin CcdB